MFAAISHRSLPSWIKFPTCSKHMRYRSDKSHRNRTEIAASLHMRCNDATNWAQQKFHWKVRQKSQKCKRAFSKQSFRYINWICEQLSSLTELKFDYKIYFKIASFYSTFMPAITDRKPLQFKEKRTERLSFSFRAPLDPGLYFRHVEHTVIMIHQ